MVLVTLSLAAGAADEKAKAPDRRPAKASQAEGEGRRGRRGRAEGQLRQAGPADLPGPVPGLPPAGQGRRRLRDDGVRPACSRGARAARPRVVPGKPDESHLIDKITPAGRQGRDAQGQAAALGRRDRADHPTGSPRGPSTTRPPTARARYDQDHPPVYTRLPVITAIDFSPDGSLLAVAGFHEVLLWKADGSELVARLVGLSERIESLGVLARRQAAGRHRRPARPDGRGPGLGRRQAEARRSRSPSRSTPSTARAGRPTARRSPSAAPTTPCGPSTPRPGEQVLFMGSHNDWVLDTVFSVDGIAPDLGRPRHDGQADRGRHPAVRRQHHLDHARGAQGRPRRRRPASRSATRSSWAARTASPKLYRVFRQTVRVIGDDSNLIREFPPMPGRVTSVAVSADGKRIAAGSSLDGAGEVDVYGYEFDTELPRQHQGDQPEGRHRPVGRGEGRRSRSTTRTACKRDRQASRSPQGGIYAVAFRPDGKVLAAAGADGIVRLLNPETGSSIKEFAPRRRAGQPRPRRTRRPRPSPPKQEEAVETETLPPGASLVGAGGPAERDPLDAPVRLRPAPGHRPARLGRDDRRDPDGRDHRCRRRSPRSRGRAWSGPGPTARRR